MNPSRLKDLISLFSRYREFYISNWDYSTKLFLKAAKSEKDVNLRKILVLRIFYEMMQSCENVVRLVRVLHDTDKNPFENLLSQKEDNKYLKITNIEKELDIIESYKGDVEKFFIEYFKIQVFYNKLSKRDQKALNGILSGIRAAFKNMIASPKGVHRVLWSVYTKIKHGAPVMNKSGKDSVVVYLGSNKPIEFPVALSDGEVWSETTEALKLTMINITKLVLDRLKASSNINKLLIK